MRDAGLPCAAEPTRGSGGGAAFDLLEIGGDDLRNLPLIERKRRLARLIDKTKKWRAIQYSGHLTGDGPCSPTSARWAWRASRLGVNPTKEGL